MIRKKEKQEILQFIDNLFRAHEEINMAIKNGNLASAQVMVQECQDYGIQLGNVIEKMEGEESITVSNIEQYCESLFYIYTELNKMGYNQYRISKILRNKLAKVENSVKNDLIVRKEIAFFPYKASMWDSLESIYLRMKEQQNCNVCCVPIPYYDLKPDGSFGDMHYEGLEYPKNVEVINWQDYHFEEIKPDIIFIHNPYDNMNYVTSVHPRFYSKNLKKYTDELVYIPYFILNEISPDNQDAIENIKHFCFLPGVINADRVIVQSENMRQIYINEFLKAAQKYNLKGKYIERRYLEQKILGSGSPKIEKVKNTKKKDLDIPAEWLKIFKKSDGNWKKIVFYNISINSLLQNGEVMITKKIPCTFADLKKRKDEIALLWRPHPLLISTIKAMRPQLWNIYKRLVDDYLSEGWGVYDESADVDRAVILSDIYYGSESSVVRLYETTHKPILLQECAFEHIKSTCIIGDCIYCLNSIGNSIVCLLPMKNELMLKWKFKLCDVNYAFEKLFAYGDRIILIPRKSNTVVIFNPESLTMDRIKLSMDNEFVTYYFCGNVVYLFPCMGQAIVAVDLKSREAYSYVLPDEIKKGVDKAVFSCDYAKIEDCFFLLIYGTNQIVEFNIVNKQFKVHKLPDNYLLNCLCGNGHKIWIMANDCMISEWNYATNKVGDLQKCPANNDDLFCISIFVKETDEIWIASIRRGKILIYNFKNNQTTQMDLSDEGLYIWMIEKHDQWMWVFFDRADVIISINIFTREIVRLQII